jgi:DNA-binding transcriptional regulator GbsR (MarR family)
MPGGRLTEWDRQRVATGLAEGLGYAEIAKQLGRPTSTVTREVARNGGPGGYRADRAHQATWRRARRRQSAKPSGPPAAADVYGRDPEAVREFLEQFVKLMVQTGLPPMASRVFACLVITDSGVLTAAELVGRLRVSPASVSKAIGYLEGLDLIRRERDPGRRRDRYLIDDDLWLRTWLTDAQRHATWADTAQEGVTVFGAATPAGARLDQMSQFFAQLASHMAGGPLIPAAVDDALTVLAALLYVRAPLTVDQLAIALGWPSDRISSALYTAEQYPDIADPIALLCLEPRKYAITVKQDRLSPSQCQALTEHR